MVVIFGGWGEETFALSWSMYISKYEAVYLLGRISRWERRYFIYLTHTH